MASSLAERAIDARGWCYANGTVSDRICQNSEHKLRLVHTTAGHSVVFVLNTSAFDANSKAKNKVER